MHVQSVMKQPFPHLVWLILPTDFQDQGISMIPTTSVTVVLVPLYNWEPVGQEARVQEARRARRQEARRPGGSYLVGLLVDRTVHQEKLLLSGPVPVLCWLCQEDVRKM